eukprot:15449686-Alexandrium_andersonii.AAC.1
MPICAARHLSKILNCIESGAAWPEQLTTIMVAFIAKEEALSLDPLKYRGIAIIVAVYRGWAKMRLQHVREWSMSWRHPGLYAGVVGAGAQDAWQETSVAVEARARQGHQVAMATVDMR